MLIERGKAALAEAEVWRKAGRGGRPTGCARAGTHPGRADGPEILIDRADALLAELDASQ
jgi:hypothetical protein